MDVLAILERLGHEPPQTILLEGGTEESRLTHALEWAKIINCPNAIEARASGRTVPGCGECAVCKQLSSNNNLDLYIYDGRISNRQDEENPGPVRALSIANMRELKTLTAMAPHGSGKRIAIFQGMSQTREEALNSLLKTLEEPSAHTRFVLLAPQRAQLLPTLVSRSLCLTLPWTSSGENRGELAEWEDKLAFFLTSGSGFLEEIGKKGVLDVILAMKLILAIQKSLTCVLAQKAPSRLPKALLPLASNPANALLAVRWANEAQEMLNATVNPPRVVEAFITRLFTLLHQ